MVQSQLTSTLCRFFMWFFGRSLSRLAASLSTWTLETVGGHISVWFSAPYEESFIIFPLPLQNIHTFLQHSSQASPVQKHFITLLVFTFLQFVFNERDCITSAMHRCWLSLNTWSIPKLSDFFFLYFKQTTFESFPALALVSSGAFSISDQSEAANGELPFRRMLLSALSSYDVVNQIVKQI